MAPPKDSLAAAAEAAVAVVVAVLPLPVLVVAERGPARVRASRSSTPVPSTRWWGRACHICKPKCSCALPACAKRGAGQGRGGETITTVAVAVAVAVGAVAVASAAAVAVAAAEEVLDREGRLSGVADGAFFAGEGRSYCHIPVRTYVCAHRHFF